MVAARDRVTAIVRTLYYARAHGSFPPPPGSRTADFFALFEEPEVRETKKMFSVETEVDCGLE